MRRLGRVNSHIRNSYILELLSDVDGAGTAYDQGFAGASSGDDCFGEKQLLGGRFDGTITNH